MKNTLLKGASAAGVAIGFALAPMASQASTLSCGTYSIDVGTTTSFVCESYGTDTISTLGPVTSTITHNGASTLDQYGTTTITQNPGLSSWGSTNPGTFSSTLNATTDYLVLVWDTPLSGNTLNPWMVLSATGADLMSSISVTDSLLSSNGTFKYRIYTDPTAPTPGTVPVPGSLALMGAGLLAIALRKKAAF